MAFAKKCGLTLISMYDLRERSLQESNAAEQEAHQWQPCGSPDSVKILAFRCLVDNEYCIQVHLNKLESRGKVHLFQ